MAFIKLDLDAATAMVKAAADYGDSHHMRLEEMGTALVMAGTVILSRGLNNIQLDDVYRHVANCTAELRKPNAS